MRSSFFDNMTGTLPHIVEYLQIFLHLQNTIDRKGMDALFL